MQMWSLTRPTRPLLMRQRCFPNPDPPAPGSMNGVWRVSACKSSFLQRLRADSAVGCVRLPCVSDLLSMTRWKLKKVKF